MDIKSGKQVIEEKKLMQEKNDCTVRALMEVLGVGYLEAYGMLIGFGRKKGRGIVVDQCYNSFCKAKFERPGMTVESYVKMICHTGKWIIGVRGHVFAVIDGVIKDEYPAGNLRCHVTRVWKF